MKQFVRMTSGYTLSALLLASGGALLMSLTAARAASTEIKGQITASCSLTVPATVDLGTMNRLDIEEGPETGVALYAMKFDLTPVCDGTQKYRLNVKAEQATSAGCADSDSGAMAFCLYHDDKQISLSDPQGGNVEATTAGGRETLRVMPARGSKPTTTGKHSASVTATISPM